MREAGFASIIVAAQSHHRALLLNINLSTGVEAMDQTRITRIGNMKARPGQADTLRAFLESVVVAALENAAGCQSCRLLQSQAEPERFVIIEVWDNIEAHQASVKNISPEDIEAVMQLLAEQPAGEYYSG